KYITTNPLAGHGVTELYKRARGAKSINPFDPSEVALVLDIAKRTEPDYYCLFLVLFKTGMRDGEAVALKESDIDYKNRRLHVRRIIERVTRQESETTKTQVDRWVKVSEEVLQAIREHRVAQEWRFTQQGKATPELLFTNSEGNFIDISNLRRLQWSRI